MIKKVTVLMFMLLIWIAPVFDYNISVQTFIFFIMFIINLLIVDFVKNKAISLMISILIFTGLTIYDYTYALCYIIPFCLICEYTNAENKDKQKSGKERYVSSASMQFG